MIQRDGQSGIRVRENQHPRPDHMHHFCPPAQLKNIWAEGKTHPQVFQPHLCVSQMPGLYQGQNSLSPGPSHCNRKSEDAQVLPWSTTETRSGSKPKKALELQHPLRGLSRLLGVKQRLRRKKAVMGNMPQKLMVPLQDLIAQGWMSLLILGSST